MLLGLKVRREDTRYCSCECFMKLTLLIVDDKLEKLRINEGIMSRIGVILLDHGEPPEYNEHTMVPVSGSKAQLSSLL